MRFPKPVYAGLLAGVITCGGQNSRTQQGPGIAGNGNEGGGGDGSRCPQGYPYCPTIDACLLPGRECPPADDDEPNGVPGAGGSDTVGALGGSDGEVGAAGKGEVNVGGQPGGLSSVLWDSTPGQIRCGNDLCDSFNEYCCASSDGVFDTCSGPFCPLRRECDEQSDCLGDDVCCYSAVQSPPVIMAGICEPAGQCVYDQTWLACGSQADCEALGAPPCVSQPCGRGTMQTCGPITRSFCH